MIKNVILFAIILFTANTVMAQDNLICQSNGKKGSVACLSTKSWNTLQCKVDNNDDDSKEIVVHCNLPNTKEVYTVKAHYHN